MVFISKKCEGSGLQNKRKTRLLFRKFNLHVQYFVYKHLHFNSQGLDTCQTYHYLITTWHYLITICLLYIAMEMKYVNYHIREIKKETDQQ